MFDCAIMVHDCSGIGATLFDLSALQEEYRDEPGSVLELDFYNAGTLLPLGNSSVEQRALSTWLPACNPTFAGSTIKDSSILRFRSASITNGLGPSPSFNPASILPTAMQLSHPSQISQSFSLGSCRGQA